MAERTPQIPQEVVDLYDEYTHAPLERRVFLDRLARVAGGAAAAAALLPLLEADYANAQVVPEQDPRLATETVRIPAEGGGLLLYVARPAGGTAPLPAVVVVHENRGLNPHIRDVARRAALAGHVAVAPDFLSVAHGETPADEDRARTLIGGLDRDLTLRHALAAAGYARSGRADVTGRVGTIGFCWGGGLVNRMAAADPDIDATVSFYGSQPSADEARTIRSPLLLHYASLDERINRGIPEFAAALDAAGAPWTMHMYEGVNHAFHNDTAAARYDRDAAELAWSRTQEFLARHLAS